MKMISLFIEQHLQNFEICLFCLMFITKCRVNNRHDKYFISLIHNTYLSIILCQQCNMYSVYTLFCKVSFVHKICIWAKRRLAVEYMKYV